MTPSEPDKYLDCYQLRGRSTPSWTPRAKARLLLRLKKIAIRLLGAQLPEADKTLGRQARDSPGKMLRMMDSYLDRPMLENRQRQAETEKAYAETELLKAQCETERVAKRDRELDVQSKELDLLERELSILERLRKITMGKPLPKVLNADGQDVVGLIEELPPTSPDSTRYLPADGGGD